MIEKYIILVLPMFFLVSGCENNFAIKKSLSYSNGKVISVSGDKVSDLEKMERCRRELDILKKIDNTVYTKRKVEFDKLLTGASLYTGVRNEVGHYTQSTVDALYRFKADKLCADISNDVLNGLSEMPN
ncbi:hypothetical protein ACK1C0_002799 [Salmonella enterica]